MRARSPVLPRSDELLARLVGSGGERPFRALYDRHHRQLYRYCYSLVRNDSDAQDALQSTFTRALIALRQGKRSAPLRPWLYRIAHNEAISILRARGPVVPQSDPEPLRAGPSAEERMHERARLQLLLSDLAELAEQSRAALVMRELGGLSHEEIACALEVSTGAAKQAIFEGRSALLELEEGRAMACDEVRRKLSDGDRRVLRGRQVRAHLRDCVACAAFAASTTERQAQLRALTPAPPAAVAAAVLVRAVQGASSGGHAAVGASAASSGSTLVGTGGAGAGSISAAKMIAAVATPKALLATAVIAGAAAAGGLVVASPGHHAAAQQWPGGSSPARSTSSGHRAHSGRASSQPRSASSQSRSPAARPVANGRHNSATPRNVNPSNAAKSGHGRNPAASNPPGPPPWPPGAKHPSNSSSGKSNAARSRTGVPPGLAVHHHTLSGRGARDYIPPGQAKKH